jgi:microcystin-dependent protein
MAEKISITKGFDSNAFDTYVPELSDSADIQNAFELFYYGNSEDGNATGDVSLHANLVDFDARITANDSDISGHTGATSDVHGTGAGQSVVGTGTVQTITNKTINLTSNTLTGTLAQFNTALSDANFATIAGTETLTGKTLTSPVITGGTINGGVALTVTSTELNVIDGITASTAELNIMDGVTSSTAEINILDGVTSTTAELNILDGVTSTTAELNILDGVTASTAELNYVDGVTSSIQTQINTNTPTGMISIHSASVAPTGWLICDGGSYSTTTYANLFSTVGYTFGGSGANFNVPNLKGRVVVGIDGAQTQFDTRGETGGSMTHQHAASNSASASTAHNHSIDPPNTGTNNAAPNTGNADVNHDHTLNIGEEGTGASN